MNIETLRNQARTGIKIVFRKYRGKVYRLELRMTGYDYVEVYAEIKRIENNLKQ